MIDFSDMNEDELRRKNLTLDGKTVLANKRTDVTLIAWAEEAGVYVPIDRRSIWGNPFLLGVDGERDVVVDNYRRYYDLKPSLIKEIETLRGKVLGCWCYPKLCHGNILMEVLG